MSEANIRLECLRPANDGWEQPTGQPVVGEIAGLAAISRIRFGEVGLVTLAFALMTGSSATSMRRWRHYWQPAAGRQRRPVEP